MTILSFRVAGDAVIDTDLGTIDLHLTSNGQPPVPPDPPAIPGDAIDMQSVIITPQSPDVRSWPVGAHLSSVGIYYGDKEMTIDFSKRWGPGAWPIVRNMEGGEIQYTLWYLTQLGHPNGPWYAGGGIDCISRGENDNYVPTGGVLNPRQIPDNWFYFLTGDGTLGNYQPAIGEPVGWFLTAGAQRRDDVHVVMERTQIVIAPFMGGVFNF